LIAPDDFPERIAITREAARNHFRIIESQSRRHISHHITAYVANDNGKVTGKL
jgi:hypothetical protein